MKILPSILTIVAAVAVTSCGSEHYVSVVNSLDVDRAEVVEVDLADLARIAGDGPYAVVGSDDVEAPSQITSDGKLIFWAEVGANSTADYKIVERQPAKADTVAVAAFYPQRKDDLAWENDRSAYRAYGPALQQSGERAFGYDIWTKSVDHPVVSDRYDKAFNHDLSFHEDHGDGMDVYSVGPTLGGGTAALLDSLCEIVYPYCFEKYEIVDNGPLRVNLSLTYGPVAVDSDSAVVEHRLISLDKGSYLNRTVVSYEGLSKPRRVAPGIVLHCQNPDGYALLPKESVMAYADLTDNESAGNGIIFVGVVAPQADTLSVDRLPKPEGDAIGHLLAKSLYEPGDEYTYYWGSGWSKGSMPDWQSWKDYLASFSRRLDNPLKIEIR